MDYWPRSERVLLVRLNGRLFNINIIQVYAPTQDHSDAETEVFYEKVEQALKYSESNDVLCVMGTLMQN